MPGYFSTSTIVLSFVIASVAGLAAFECIEHTRYSRHPALWTFISGLTLGLGIWAMHFTGMLAWIPPFAMYYSVGFTLLSVLAAVGASWLAMRITVNYREGSPQHHLIGGATLVGTGICGMHYLGMAAMHFSPPASWSVPGVLLSYLIAVFASLGAMVMLQSSTSGRFNLGREIAASLIVGTAICGMHYTGMLAMMLPDGSVCLQQPGSVPGSTLGRAGVGSAMAFVLCVMGVSLFKKQSLRSAERMSSTGPKATPEH